MMVSRELRQSHRSQLRAAPRGRRPGKFWRNVAPLAGGRTACKPLLFEERIYVGFAAAVATYQLFLQVVLDVVQRPPFR